MVLQSLPAPTLRFASQLQREQVRLERSLKQVARRTVLGESFAPLAVLLTARVSDSQERIAVGGQQYVSSLLGPADDLVIDPLIGVTGMGVPVREVFETSRIMSTQESLRMGVAWALQLAHTAVADIARQSIVLGASAHDTSGYVRAVVGETCARCVVLAGAFYGSAEAFDRHPNCDCIHVPYRGDPPADAFANGDEYFESLSVKDQDRIFTKAGAEAIRSGANVNQVVNARRGMQKAQVFGRELLVTSEGMTRRGFAYSRLRGRREDDIKLPGQRYARARAPRMMPESILQVSTKNGQLDREMFERLLRQHGYKF